MRHVMPFLMALLILLPLVFTHQALAATTVDGAKPEQVQIEEFGLYRLAEPRSVFFDNIPEERLNIGVISGPLPSGLVPTLGTIDRLEVEPGKFEEDIGLILVYFRGTIGQAGVRGYLYRLIIYDPKGAWQIIRDYGGRQGEQEVTLPFYVYPMLHFGVWSISAQTLEKPPRTMFNASFTVGRYYADISVDELLSDRKSTLVLDGVPVGEIAGKTSIALGWLPEHTISLSPPPPSDIASDRQGSRYHLSQSELKVPGPGEYHLPLYVSQHLLTVDSVMGSPQGSGWYDDGSFATFSVTSPIAIEGIMGSLGGKYVFDHWRGDSNAVTTSASVVMDGPKTVTTEWHADYTMPYTIIGAVVAVVVAVATSAVFLGRKRSTVSKPQVKSVQETGIGPRVHRIDEE